MYSQTEFRYIYFRCFDQFCVFDQVDIREAVTNITYEQGIQLTPGGDLFQPGELDGIPFFPTNITAVFTPTVGTGERLVHTHFSVTRLLKELPYT